MEFVKALTKFTVFVSILLGLLLFCLGAAILLFPQMILRVLAYVMGGALLVAGLLFFGGTVRALLKP